MNMSYRYGYIYLPVNEISPVIHTKGLTGFESANDNKLVTKVHPALGPSFFTAPSAQCIWTTLSSKNLLFGSSPIYVYIYYYGYGYDHCHGI